MAVPDVKQVCPICSEDVTDAEYRRELTCSFGACPGREHACHEECMTKYLRKLQKSTDQLIGYPCPVTLGNGKPCSGRIISTHHKQPLNQKKKQKRVEAAAAAAAFQKPRQPVGRPKEAKPGVAAATAAMRPVGDVGSRQPAAAVNSIKPVSSMLPTVKGAIQSVTPGSGPAARLKGNALITSAVTPDRVVRRHIPGWTGPETVNRPNMSALEQQRELQRAMVAEQRAKAAALKAELEASKGRSSKNQPIAAHTAAGTTAPIKDDGGLRSRQSIQQQHIDDSDRLSEASDTHPFSKHMWEDSYNSESGDGSPAPPEKPQDFFLAQEDFPAFPNASSLGYAVVTNGSTIAASVDPSAISNQLTELMFTSSGGSSASSSPLASLPSGPFIQNDAMAPMYAAAPADCPENDPVLWYDQLFAAEDGQYVVMDANGTYHYMETVYGPDTEIIPIEDSSGVAFHYIVVRQSMVAAQDQQNTAAAVINDEPAGAEVTTVLEQSAIAAPQESPYIENMTAVPIDNGGMDGSASVSVPGTGQEMTGGPSVTGGANEQGNDLDDLLALCMITAPLVNEKPVPSGPEASPQLEPWAKFMDFAISGNMASGTNLKGAGGVMETPSVTEDDAEAVEIDSLMQLLGV